MKNFCFASQSHKIITNNTSFKMNCFTFQVVQNKKVSLSLSWLGQSELDKWPSGKGFKVG